MKYVKAERLWLTDHPEVSETWVKDRIAEDPPILGLGDDLRLVDRERIQARTGGYVDMILNDDDGVRYEVEVQLGTLDADHIVRGMHYWNRERLRSPQVEHRAVLIAEEIGRFADVLPLFQNAPIVIEMAGYDVGDDGLQLTFHRMSQEPADEELDDGGDGVQEPVDRDYWLATRASEASLAIMDGMIELARRDDPKIKANYHRHSIGLIRDGIPDNYLTFAPRKGPRIDCLLRGVPQSTVAVVVEQGLVCDWERWTRRPRLHLKADDLVSHEATLLDLIKRARGEEG